MRPLEWHEDDDEDRDEDEDPFEIPRVMVPGRRKNQTPTSEAVMAQVVQVARDYERSLETWEEDVRGIPLAVPVIVPNDAGIPALFALAVASALLATGVGLLGHGLKRSLPMAAQLEGGLSRQLRTLSMRRGGGRSGGGKFQNWTERLRASSGSRKQSADSGMVTLR